MKCIFLFSFIFKPSHKAPLGAMPAKPMFKVNKPWLIPKNILVMWHNIWCMSWNILPCHLKFATWKQIYKKDFMTWHGIFSKIFSCSCEPTHLLALLGTNMPLGMFLNFWRGEPIGWCKHAPKGCFLSFWRDGDLISHQVPIKFLLFPSMSHQNPFVLTKFPNNFHQVPLVPMNNSSRSFCSH